MEPPVFQVDPHGRLANRMIQYMVALAFADRVGGCRFSDVDLPAWGLQYPRLEPPAPIVRHHSRHHIDLDALAAQVMAGEARTVYWSGWGQRLENFLPRERYRSIFVAPFPQEIGFGPDVLVCPIRAEDILTGREPNYPLTPVEFYRDIVAMTGLRPVFIGQTEPNAYMDRLRAEFPNATIRAPQADPLVDFETIRQSRHVVVGVSTYSWLAAWLSETIETVFMAVSGLFNPRQVPDVDLLPLGDPRFRFFLFPINYAVSLDRHAELHRRIAPYWHVQSHALLQQQLMQAPRFGWSIEEALAAFDEAFYLQAHSDVANYAPDKPGFGRFHYINYGFQERRVAVRVDPIWYATRYPIAAFEIARGDFADATHHYTMAGRARGYRPVATGDDW